MGDGLVIVVGCRGGGDGIVVVFNAEGVLEDVFAGANQLIVCVAGVEAVVVAAVGAGRQRPHEEDDFANEGHGVDEDPPAATVDVVQAADGDSQDGDAKNGHRDSHHPHCRLTYSALGHKEDGHEGENQVDDAHNEDGEPILTPTRTSAEVEEVVGEVQTDYLKL